MIDFDAMRRVMGEAVADRFGILSEGFSDLADAPSLVCMAIEQAGQNDETIGDAMSRLLDQWERETFA